MPTTRLSLGLIVVALGVASTSARAAPYTLVARYSDGAPDHWRRLTPTADQQIPDSGTGWALADFAVRFPSAPFGLLPAQAFGAFRVEVQHGDSDAEGIDVPLTGLGAGGEFRVDSWHDAALNDETSISVRVTVRATIGDAMMCALEAAYREREGKARGAAAARVAADTAAGAAFKDGKAPALALASNATAGELYASYCHATDWNAAAKLVGSTTAAELAAAQRVELYQRLRPGLADLFLPWAKLSSESPTVIETLRFSVFRTGGIFTAYEHTSDGVRELSTTVDLDSNISFFGPKDSGWCPLFEKAPFRYVLAIDGGAEPQVEVTPTRIERCELLLEVDLQKLKDKPTTVRAMYRLDGTDELVLYEKGFVPREVGLVWTAPVLSEVRALMNGWNRDQLRAQSSVPLSWAIGLDGAADGVAVTLPFTISYATRATPELPRIVAFYPHLSVLLTQEDDDATPVTYAAGFGLAFYKSLYFSYAFGFEGAQAGNHFLLFGLSIDGLTNLKPTP